MVTQTIAVPRQNLLTGTKRHATALYAAHLTDPNHDAVIRIGCEAPGSAHDLFSRPIYRPGNRGTGSAASGDDRRAARLEPLEFLSLLGASFRPPPSAGGARDDAVRHYACSFKAPQSNQQLAGERHDHWLARASGGCRPGLKPLCKRTRPETGGNVTPGWIMARRTRPFPSVRAPSPAAGNAGD